LFAVLESRIHCGMFCGVGHAGEDWGALPVGGAWDAKRLDHNGGMNVGFYDGHVKFVKQATAADFGVD
jgi:prepilin-type processing-associated H-X9-DG protein